MCQSLAHGRAVSGKKSAERRRPGALPLRRACRSASRSRVELPMQPRDERRASAVRISANRPATGPRTSMLIDIPRSWYFPH